MIDRRGLLKGATGVAAFVASGGARAQSVEAFYRGKNVSIIIPVGPGGGTSAYFQVVARHLGKHIPGNPSITAQYMPGAGGVKAMLYGEQAAARDGTVLLTPPDSVAVAQMVSPEAQYDSRKFRWIGTFASTRAVLVVTKAAGVRNIEDLKKKELVIGAAGPGSSSQYDPILANQLVGAKLKVITGYDGFGGCFKAMQGGELHGTTQNWQTWKSQKGMFDDGSLVAILQYGIEGDGRLKDLPNVPSIIEFATKPEDKALVNFLESQSLVGRGLIVPPGVPDDRLMALRAAFDKLIVDPEFKASIDKAILAIDPKPADVVEAVIRKTIDVSPSVLERAKQLMSGG